MDPDPTELIRRLRQQLILAQVRLMEIEDERDTLSHRLANHEKLLVAAQALADTKQEEASHLERVRSETQAQFEHMRHMQHITNEALNQTRADLTAREGALATAQRSLEDFATDFAALRAELAARTDARAELQRNLDSTASDLAATRAEAAALKSGLEALRLREAELETQASSLGLRLTGAEEELRAMRSSRSWRWTAWLRALAGVLSRRP